MPWTTPTLRNVRELVRGEITTSLGRASFVGNSVLRVMADAQAALTHLVLRYIDWLALQLLPDTAEAEWLDRHGDIWLVNADGSTGRKAAGLARGSVTMTGINGSVVPQATQLTDNVTTYETTETILVGSGTTEVRVIAINPGSIGNHPAGDSLAFVNSVADVDDNAIVVDINGGTDVETDDELRARVLRRIQQPPMGGAAHDYEAWALAVPGVTRAWCVGNEMGIGTVTVRFMMDELRADNDGFPFASDCEVVAAYINTKRPVSVEDCFVVAPIPNPINFDIMNLVPDTTAMRASIEESVTQMIDIYAAPGQTIYAAWKFSAVMSTIGVVSFNMPTATDDVMESPGHLAVLGDIYFSTPVSVV